MFAYDWPETKIHEGVEYLMGHELTSGQAKRDGGGKGLTSTSRDHVQKEKQRGWVRWNKKKTCCPVKFVLCPMLKTLENIKASSLCVKIHGI